MRAPLGPLSPDVQRILCYGVTGTGKTTLAREIARRTGLPLHEIDELTWEPGWVPVDDDEQVRRAAEVTDQESWVLDSAYSKFLAPTLERAQLVVALDYPRRTSLRRLIARSIARVWDKREICNGNVETWRQLVSRDSIVAWHFRSFERKHRQIQEMAGSPTVRVLVLTSPTQARQWLDLLPTGPER